ncbi:hypothetical protein [Pyrococcus kukulkanii]|uniref:Uncharacterized protein n=1 Tax=Pyrococcus kukulkanii TaxID=1609559 RepID=A0ABV4T695_9EURY
MPIRLCDPIYCRTVESYKGFSEAGLFGDGLEKVAREFRALVREHGGGVKGVLMALLEVDISPLFE